MLNLNEIPVSETSNEPLPLIPDGTIVRGVLMFEGGDHVKPEFSQSARFFKKSQIHALNLTRVMNASLKVFRDYDVRIQIIPGMLKGLAFFPKRNKTKEGLSHEKSRKSRIIIKKN